MYNVCTVILLFLPTNYTLLFLPTNYPRLNQNNAKMKMV